MTPKQQHLNITIMSNKEERKLNIYQRLNEVRKEVDYLQKDANVQGYKAITHDAVTSAIRQPFIDNGIMILPNQTDSNTVEVGETKNGTTIIRYSAWYEVSFVNINNPEDKLITNVESHAMDMGDKAPGKAMSYAVKYAMLKVLNIETGESEESRIEIAEKKKPVFTPESDGWNKAVQAFSDGTADESFMKERYRISKKHLEQLKKESEKLNHA